MRTVRVSEIGTYRYCKRSWWYQRRGVPSENQVFLDAGQRLHEKHGRVVITTGCIQGLAYIFLLAALLLFAAYITRILL